ncbi:alkaline phosphatase [Bacteroides sp. OttesenSCG-928-J23]|nr:alkaline phosphatase [Bacteroides sp. OttesenSCG-928-J23]MDL2303786.1 alkaline phosphatase [Bacteroides sp. OttesenSCG-928-D19]
MKKIIFWAIMALGLVACTPNKAPQVQPKAQHMVFIGLDGWGSYSMHRALMPNVRKLMETGSYTLQKRTVLPSSSAVNWASMFMGAGPELHGFTNWGTRVPELPSRELNQHGIFPTIFQLLRDAQPEAEIGCLYEWEGIKYLVDTLALNHYAQVPEDMIYTDKLTRMAEEYIKEKQPNLVAIIYDNPDHVGHQAGHDTPAYYEELENLDKQVGRIVRAVDEAGMMDETIFIVTSDHGGIGTNHGGKTMAEMETPFIIAGKNIKPDGEFNQSMMQFDTGATMATIFNLEQPQVWIGRPMMQVFQ